MNSKVKKTKKQVVKTDFVGNVLSKDEISKKIQILEQELQSSTWRELETSGGKSENHSFDERRN